MLQSIYQKRDVLLLSLFIFLCSMYMFKENLRIKLGPIDDHEIVRFLGSDRQLWLWQIPNVMIQKTEVGQYSEYPRFRPTYYLLRLLETSAFGTDSFAWYLNRIIMVSFTCLFFMLGLRLLFGFRNKYVKGLIFIWFGLSFLSISAWQDIVSRLGPSEIYLALGVSLFFYLGSHIVMVKYSLKSWGLASLVLVLIVGTKENAVLLIIPYTTLAGFAFLTEQKNKLRIIYIYLLGILFTASISTGWLLGTMKNGGDVYGASRTFGKGLSQATQSISGYLTSLDFFVLIMIFLFYVFVSRIRSLPFSRDFFFILASVVMILAIKLGEVIFYEGNFGTFRYAVMSQMLTLLTYALLFILFVNSLFILNSNNRLLTLMVFLIGFFMLATTVKGFVESRKIFTAISDSYMNRSEAFQIQLSQIDRAVSTGNFDAIAIQISDVFDYEYAYAFSQYIEFNGGDLPRFLTIVPFDVAPGYERSLLDQMEGFSEKGDSTWLVEPIDQLKSDDEVYCVAINSAPLDERVCDN